MLLLLCSVVVGAGAHVLKAVAPDKFKKFRPTESEFGWTASSVSVSARSSSSAAASSSEGLPGLRWDAPSHRGRDRGQLPCMSNPHDRDVALDALVEDFHAASNKKALKAKWATVTKAMKNCSLEPFPPSRDTVLALAASWKAGRYASAESYLQLYKTNCDRAGHAFTPQLAVLHKDCVRSCVRGLGGAFEGAPLTVLEVERVGLGRGRGLDASRASWTRLCHCHWLLVFDA